MGAPKHAPRTHPFLHVPKIDHVPLLQQQARKGTGYSNSPDAPQQMRQMGDARMQVCQFEIAQPAGACFISHLNKIPLFSDSPHRSTCQIVHRPSCRTARMGGTSYLPA